MAQMNKPLTGKDKDTFKSFLKPTPSNKLIEPKAKIGEKTNKVLPIRGIKI